ncbi:MAG: PEP-CTERM sorting domain-containing protein [Akkermansiaceae bacterium]
MKKTLTTTAALLVCVGSASASLWVDFNSNQGGGGAPVSGDPSNATSAAKNAAGYQSYHVAHEVAADFIGATYPTTLDGSPNVTLTPTWSNTSDNRVQQSIGRSAANDANYTNPGSYPLELVTDWIGVDTRTGNGGNGNFDGTTGTPTWIELTLSGLPAGDYSWTSIHHDTENVFTNFNVYVDGVLDGSGYQNDSTLGGNPSSGTETAGPANTYTTTFSSTGADVVLRFEPLSGELGNAVHNQLFAINGFQLENAIPEPSTGLLGLLGAVMLFRRRR